MAYDILIKSGLIFDGTGAPPLTGDIGIEGDKITAIGTLNPVGANKVIDAAGKYVAPGFIDLTNHSDTHLTLFKYPALESLLMQGITTAVGGACGISLAPLGSAEVFQAVRRWTDPAEININWANVGEFLDELEKLKLGVNFATFIGYGTIRRGVLGDEIRLLNLEEQEKVKLLLRNGLKEGAFGLSLGLSSGHERISSTEEIIEISRVVKEVGGIVKIHLRSEGQDILASVNEVIRIAREGIPVHINHLKAIGRKAWPSIPKALTMIERARSNGVDITFDVSPYPATGSPLYLLLPSSVREGGFKELLQKIGDPKEREKIIASLQSLTLHYDKLIITSAKLTALSGRSILELAQSSGLSPEETLLEALRANEGRVSILGKTISLRNTDREILHPVSLVASNGSGYNQEAARSGNLVHPRCFGAFAHFWHRYVTDSGKITPQEAIQKITSRPAERIGLKNRGTLKRGNFADIVIFEPRILRDRATYRDPYHYPAGMEWVIVNGEVAVEQGKILGVRAGRVLRKI